MSKITFSIIPFILIVLVSVFFFLSPKFFTQPTAGGGDALEDVLSKRFLDIGNLIAHATFVEDAIIMEEISNLNEIIEQFSQDQPEITYIHFTDKDNKVLASSDPAMVGETFESDLLESGTSDVQENGGIYNGGFAITVGTTVVGGLFIGAQPRVQPITVVPASSPIPLVIGVVVAVIAFFIMFSMQRNLEAKIVDNINQRQEEVFSPRIDALKKEQADAQKKYDDLNNQIADTKKKLEQVNVDFEARKKEIEANPVMQSIEKLKTNESELIKRLEKLKSEEQQLNQDVKLLTQKREEITSALEAEKKEERNLHEKLDLIKKKILHLETPKK